jgi:hypothetical protein
LPKRIVLSLSAAVLPIHHGLLGLLAGIAAQQSSGQRPATAGKSVAGRSSHQLGCVREVSKDNRAFKKFP